jgi:hypothetical protein
MVPAICLASGTSWRRSKHAQVCRKTFLSRFPDSSTRLVWVNYSSVFGTKALSTLQFTRARASEWTAAAAAVVAASPPPRPPVPSSSAPQRHQVGSGSTSNFGWCALIHSSAIVPPVHSLLLLLLLLPAPAPKHMHSPAVTLATQSVRVSDSLALAAALWQVSYHGSIHGGGQRVGYTLRPSSTAASSRRRWTAEPARCPIRPSP